MEYLQQSSQRIWLIGGTQESSILAAAIARFQIPCTVTVTTATARSLYPQTPLLRVWVGRLDLASLGSFIQQEGIVAILDASHPYAVEISKGAIALAIQRQIPYLRYERPDLEQGTGNRGDKEAEGVGEWGSGGVEEWGRACNSSTVNSQQSNIIYLDSFNTLVTSNYLEKQRVLLTIGYRPLSLFNAWQERSTLFARLLPSTTALEAALKAGFTPERLIAIRPPISADLETALWQNWQISLVVTKASGTAGGEDVKRNVAAKLGIPLIIISRPDIEYPQQTSDLSTALEFCRQHILIQADT